VKPSKALGALLYGRSVLLFLEGLRLKTDGHWDRREHRIAARALADHLRVN
jgi:hypothetical protein